MAGKTQGLSGSVTGRTRMATHRKSRTGTYVSWAGMIRRCTNPTSGGWKHYGGRGIRVCERWRKFEHFFADMGARPIGATIERSDPNGHYEPMNCRWATPGEQQRNRRNTVFIEHDGLRLTLPTWAKKLGINQATLRSRLRRAEDPEDALTMLPKRPRLPGNKPIRKQHAAA